MKLETANNGLHFLKIPHLKAASRLMLFLCLVLAGPPASAQTFDPGFASWGRFLGRFLEKGRVAYHAVKEDPHLLNRSIENLRQVNPDDYSGWTREQKIALWINAYNIAAVKVVTDHYPVDRGFSWKALAYPGNSIQQIGDVWNREILTVMGRPRSLDGIEKGILVKEFGEPRIHFALVCASIGCPVLRENPYTAKRLETQLEDQTRRFLADSQKARYDTRRNRLMLSPIFKWYRDDFRKASGSVVNFVRNHAPDDSWKKIPDDAEVDYLEYDWSLNDRK